MAKVIHLTEEEIVELMTTYREANNYMEILGMNDEIRIGIEAEMLKEFGLRWRGDRKKYIKAV